mgnify:CR=1 FL=1
MNKKVLIFGAYGMLGHVLAKYLQINDDYTIVRCARKAKDIDVLSVDITDSKLVRQILEKEKPDIVINCVGLLVKASEADIPLAILTNSYFPNYLTKLGEELKFKLIHISTDCVFSGKTGHYSDIDFRDGETYYARTKALGEIINKKDLTIRTSIIGPELKTGTGLFSWFMNSSGNINGFTNAFWSGVTTLELSKFIDKAIKFNLTGLYQLSMSKKISKYELLKLLQKVWDKRDVYVVPCDSYFCDKSMVNTINDFKYSLPDSYETMLTELKEWSEK